MSGGSVRPSWDSETGCWISSCGSRSWTCESSSDGSRDLDPAPNFESRDRRRTDDCFEKGSSSSTASFVSALDILI
jgi:hypothetical protein